MEDYKSSLSAFGIRNSIQLKYKPLIFSQHFCCSFLDDLPQIWFTIRSSKMVHGALATPYRFLALASGRLWWIANPRYLRSGCNPEQREYKLSKPDTTEFIEIAQRVESNFFSMDIARQKNGELIIIEPGDGQISGLPDKTDRSEFYKQLQICCC